LDAGRTAGLGNRVTRLTFPLIDLPWIVFVLYWAAAAFNTRVTQKRESSVSRCGVVLLLPCGYFLLFYPHIKLGILGKRFVPESLAIETLGVFITWLGVALAIWARRHLAENWSARVMIKVDHELIRTGPYARLRHPIYSGLLLATLGTALAKGEWRGLLAVCLTLAAYSLKARKEEEMLGDHFGSAFDEHRRHTGFLLPRLR
jgi:protein-S-isoprenylcysteine O-methyltransferase Ste14